jgi:ComF family protein
MHGLVHALADLLYPRVCLACGGDAGRDRGFLCWDCMAGLEYISGEYCAQCGDPIEGVAGHEFRCSSCQDRRPGFDRARSAVRHRGTFKKAVQAFKYENAICLAADFAQLLEGCVRAQYGRIAFDAVTCVPLHARKERERTYNQSALLGRDTARRLGLPFFAGCLVRARDTATQTRLSAAARRRNMRGAFEVRAGEWIEGRTLLLVDDVMTTGATVDECARALQGAGAAGVYVATLGRG